MRLFRLVDRVSDAMVQAFFPRACIGCGELIDENEWLCEVCRRRIEHTDLRRSCLRCGLPKSECRCRSNVFHFDAVTAAFYNTDIARRGFYQYKFARKRHYAEYYAREMALSVRRSFYGIEFDAVCFVPASRASLRRRGFDQAELLARRLAAILNLPVLSLLCVRGRKRVQHRLSGKERFDAVRGVYQPCGRADGFCLLLVDDIMTTGATLDECARQLRFAGADSVYCACALITRLQKRKNKEKHR